MRVLLIEDHVQLAGLVGRELSQEHGHDVMLARDPIEARAAYRAATFDLVIVDLIYEHLTRDFEARRAADQRQPAHQRAGGRARPDGGAQ
jgi:DNA-binding response OmpR family regulator